MENLVIIGKKPLEKYCFTVLDISNKFGKVVVRARGTNMVKAINLAEIVRRKFGLKVNGIKIGTEKVERDGKEKNISFIEINLKR